MCGICGIVAAEEWRAVGELDRIARRMAAAMVHRGPDDAGHLAEPGIALGMRRLSIIDRATGQQPVCNEDGSIAVIFNGEIYNCAELRQQLERQGHHFRTACDTEAIVHAYEEWGDDCLTHLRGMFALAIYDRGAPGPAGESASAPAATPARAHVLTEVEAAASSPRRGGSQSAAQPRPRRLLLARDRLGIKPLYYARRGGRLLFASEVRALLASGELSADLSPAGLESYLLFGSVAEPMTVIDDVQSLPPGHAMAVPIGAAVNGVRPHAYWTFTPEASTASASAPRAGALRSLLEDSVRVHLISDEPLGVFLSGGVDSTAIAALASRARAGVRCYTIRFREPEFDESEVARRTARRLGVEHCELLLEADEMLDGLDAAIGALDQPSVDGINTYCVSGAVRRAGAKVALSGLGGDELFGGYRTFRWMAALGRLSTVARHTPSAMRHAGARMMAHAGGWLGRASEVDRIAALCREPGALPHPFFFARTVFAPDEARAFARGAAQASAPWRTWMDESADAARHCEGPFSAVSYLEMRSYMLNTLLRDADAMSMAHSLELRVPLLDHPIVEFVSAQPDAAKQRAGAYKPLLVDALDGLLPEEVSARPKRGFTFPWATWMRGPLAPRVEAGLRDLAPPLAEHLHRAAAADTWRPFIHGRAGSGWLRPWSLFVLNEWVRRHA